jgi:2-dehydropantoate 2-reductase
MKIAILGAGAMGSVYGAILARAGDNDVWLVDRWQDHIDAIRAHGLKVTGASGDWMSPSKATTDPAEVGLCELVIVATKTRDIDSALAGASR